MARYIDADKFKIWLANEYFTFGRIKEVNDVFKPLSEFPPEDVAPVTHAHWIEDCGDYKCSHCSTEFWDEMVFIVRTSEHEFPNYCPVCGAKMDEE